MSTIIALMMIAGAITVFMQITCSVEAWLDGIHLGSIFEDGLVSGLAELGSLYFAYFVLVSVIYIMMKIIVYLDKCGIHLIPSIGG